MTNIALVVCLKEKKSQYTNGAALKRCYLIIKNLFNPQKHDCSYEKLELADDFHCYLVRLPYTLNSLSGLSNKRLLKISGYITGLCAQNRIEACILPQKVASIHLFEGCIGSRFNGDVLYRSLLLNILDVIYGRRNIEISELDVTLVQGESNEELFAVISQLSPVVKYITVLSDSKESLESELDKIYENTGLSIGISNDYAGALKNSDLIVNLRKSQFPFNHSKTGANAIILNYGSRSTTSFIGENTVINGVEVDLPASIALKLDDDILNNYNKLELSEIILCYKIGIKNAFASNTIEHKFLKGLSDEFKKAGFRIRGFMGRHAVFKIGDIKISRS